MDSDQTARLSAIEQRIRRAAYRLAALEQRLAALEQGRYQGSA